MSDDRDETLPDEAFMCGGPFDPCEHELIYMGGQPTSGETPDEDSASPSPAPLLSAPDLPPDEAYKSL